MTNKEYMSRAYLIDRRIKARRHRLEYLRTKVGAAKHDISGMPKGSPSLSSQIEELTIRIVDLEASIKQDEEELVTARTEISQSIEGVRNENLATILQMRYLDYMKWEDIMAVLDYCRSYLYELHGRALKEIKQRRLANG